VRSAALDRPLRPPVGQQPVNQTRSERVSAAHAVEDFQVLARRGLVKFSARVADSAPIVQARSLRVAERSSYDLEVWKLPDSALNHPAKIFHIQLGVVLVQPLHLKPQTGREILFVSDHHINERGQLPVNFSGAFLPADGFP
jgi:hypothetical protein